MGNDIPATDMLLSGLVRSTYNCYQFKDYIEGNAMLYDLNSFLLGFGVGIENLDPPTHLTTGIQDRLHPEQYNRTYRLRYAPLVMKALGMYIRTTIDSIKNKTYMRQY